MNTKVLNKDKIPYDKIGKNPIIQGLIARKNSLSEVNPDLIAFAKKYDLPIFLIGNKILPQK